MCLFHIIIILCYYNIVSCILCIAYSICHIKCGVHFLLYNNITCMLHLLYFISPYPTCCTFSIPYYHILGSLQSLYNYAVHFYSKMSHPVCCAFFNPYPMYYTFCILYCHILYVIHSLFHNAI